MLAGTDSSDDLNAELLADVPLCDGLRVGPVATLGEDVGPQFAQRLADGEVSVDLKRHVGSGKERRHATYKKSYACGLDLSIFEQEIEPARPCQESLYEHSGDAL